MALNSERINCCICANIALRFLTIFAGAILFIGSTTNARSDISRYLYDIESFAPSSLPISEPHFLFDQSEKHVLLDRRRRSDQSAEPQMSKIQPQQQPQQPILMTHTSANVSYTTDNVSATVEQTNHTSLVTPLQNTNNTKKIIVSTPIVPSSPETVVPDKNIPVKPLTPNVPPSKVHVWANQTKWDNVTTKTTEFIDDDLIDGLLDKYPQEITNQTLAEHNVTKTEENSHIYYNSSCIYDPQIGKKYWVDLDKDPNSHTNQLLSQSHRRAATIKLKFDFPFYGHKVRNITIATGGFLYTGDYVHSWLAATQYIAPLMANFDTTISHQSIVKYSDNGTAFTVEWRKVYLQDKLNAGPFTFQATLMNTGDIIFVYSAIPVLVESIQDNEHPVKVGLSDAYMMDRTVFFARRKTIYEYHRVSFDRAEIKNWTAIYLKALPTCLQMNNCKDCLTKIKDFDCKWCSELQQCSTGTFRFRQDWISKGCDLKNVKNVSSCPARPTSSRFQVKMEEHDLDDHKFELPEVKGISQPSQQAIVEPNHGVIGVLLVVSLVMCLAAWAAYAYRNPHSTSGQILIRYRPSQWSWRRGEARYTAATIHM